MRYSLLLFILLILSLELYAQSWQKSEGKKAVILLKDNCDVEIPERMMEEYDHILDSTLNSNCLIRTIDIFWDREATGGRYFIRILPKLAFIGLVHDNPNPNFIYMTIDISENQFSEITRFLQSKSYENFAKIPGLEDYYILSLSVKDEYLFGRYNLPKKFDERLTYLGENTYTLLKSNIIDVVTELNKAFNKKSQKIDIKAIEAIDLKASQRRLFFSY